MKTSLFRLFLALSALAGPALGLRAAPAPAPDKPAAAEITLTGVLQSRVAIGGETTGWILRYDKDQIIELTFKIDVLPLVRDGAHVSVTGTMETRRYPERGEVRVLVVRALGEIATSAPKSR